MNRFGISIQIAFLLVWPTSLVLAGNVGDFCRQRAEELIQLVSQDLKHNPRVNSAPKVRNPLERKAVYQGIQDLSQALKNKSTLPSVEQLSDLAENAVAEGLITPAQQVRISKHLGDPTGMAKALTESLQSNLDGLDSYRKFITNEANQRSTNLSQTIKSSQQAPSDSSGILMIGAGSQNAQSAALWQSLRPGDPILTLEATNASGVFDQLRGTFRVNSGEYQGVSNNLFLNSPVQVAQLNVAGDRFVGSDLFGDATKLTQRFADANVAYNQRVARISLASSEGNPVFRVETESGVTVYKDTVLIGTGMGDPAQKLTDPETLAFLKATENDPIPLVQPVDNALAKIAQAPTTTQALEPYRGKVVFVSGKGDGGKIAIEAITKDGGASEVIWIGSEWDTFEKFKAAGLGARYEETFEPIYAQKKIKTIPGHMESVLPIKSGPNAGKVRAVVKLPDGSRTEVIADLGVNALGYQNNAYKLLEDLVPDHDLSRIKLEPIMLQLPSEMRDIEKGEVLVGYQVHLDNKPIRIFIGGLATGMDKDKGFTTVEFKHVGSYVSTVGRRTEALTQMIANGLPQPSIQLLKGPRAASGAMVPQAHVFSAPIHARSELPTSLQSSIAAGIESRIELGKVLSQFRFPAQSHLHIAISKKGEGLMISIQGLDQMSAQTLAAKIMARPRLLTLLECHAECGAPADTLAPWNLEITLPTRSDGRAKLEDLTYSASLQRRTSPSH